MMLRKEKMLCWIFLGTLLLVGTACSDDAVDGDGSILDGGDADVSDADSADDVDSGSADDADVNGDGDGDGELEIDAEMPDLLDPREICADETFDMGLVPLDMLLALDTSFSMDFAPVGESFTKWQSVIDAIKAFVSDPDSLGLSVGIQYFPLRSLCNVTTYEVPAVPISMLPDSADTIAFSLDGQRMASGTPMVPMLQGAIAYTRSWAEVNPQRRTVVVMATDGIPDNTCQDESNGALANTLENVAQVAANGVEGNPSVPTFVIGVGAELTSLNQISQAGNGQDAILVDTESGNIQQSFQDALEAIRRRTTCGFDLTEMKEGNQIDFTRANVLFVDEESMLIFPNVDSVSGCGARGGWFYDNPSDPYRIDLCEETCELITSQGSGELEIRFACGLI